MPVIGGASLPVRAVEPDPGADTEQVLTEVLGMAPEAVAELTGGQPSREPNRSRAEGLRSEATAFPRTAGPRQPAAG